MSQRCQDANKSSGVCSVCQATRQLHHKDGKVHDKPCPGSNKLFLCASQQLGTGIQPQSSVFFPLLKLAFSLVQWSTNYRLLSGLQPMFLLSNTFRVCSPGVRFSFGQTVPRRRSTTKHL